MNEQNERLGECLRAPEHCAGHSYTDAVDVELSGRRSFFLWLSGIGAAVIGALLSMPLVAYALYPLLKQTSETDWSDAGDDVDFSSITAPTEAVLTIQHRDAWRVVTAKEPVYVLPSDTGEHRVLSPVCPHLGCKVTWAENEKQFVCPCHNSFFAPNGSLISGPSPRGLDYLESKTQDGRLLVLYRYFRQLLPTRQAID